MAVSKRELQRDIRELGGFTLSSGTLYDEYLIAKAHDVIVEYKIRGEGLKLKKLIRGSFFMEDPDAQRLWSEIYYGRAWLKPFVPSSELWEDCCYFLDELSPKGYYFGSLEGDGSEFGWFKFLTN